MVKAGKDGKLPPGAQTMQGAYDNTMQGAGGKMGQTQGRPMGKNDPEQHHFIPPTLDHLERKLQILPNEWYIETMYNNEDVAAIYSYWQPTQGPFLVVPSLVHEGL
jgi:hypothetical protein